MEEIMFCAMDISKEVRNMLNKVADGVCAGMTDTEKKAYEVGVETTISAMIGLFESSDEPVVYVSNLEAPEEMTFEEIKKRF